MRAYHHELHKNRVPIVSEQCQKILIERRIAQRICQRHRLKPLVAFQPAQRENILQFRRRFKPELDIIT